jgi:hypothetical protein
LYHLDFKLVKVAFYHADKEIASVIFNGVDSDMHGWFNKSHVIESSWSTLTSTGIFNQFSIHGHSFQNHYDRRFFIKREYGGCSNDCGYLVVMNSPLVSPCCLYDNTENSE